MIWPLAYNKLEIKLNLKYNIIYYHRFCNNAKLFFQRNQNSKLCYTLNIFISLVLFSNVILYNISLFIYKIIVYIIHHHSYCPDPTLWALLAKWLSTIYPKPHNHLIYFPQYLFQCTQQCLTTKYEEKTWGKKWWLT